MTAEVHKSQVNAHGSGQADQIGMHDWMSKLRPNRISGRTHQKLISGVIFHLEIFSA